MVSGFRGAVDDDEDKEKNSSSPMVRSEWVYKETRKSSGGHEGAQAGSGSVD